MLKIKKQNQRLEDMGSNLKETIVHANQQLADALAQGGGPPKEKPKEEVLIKFVKIIRTQKQVRKGSKSKQNNAPAKASNKTFIEERNAILKQLNLKPKEGGKKNRTLCSKFTRIYQKPITEQKTSGTDNFEKYMEGQSLSPDIDSNKHPLQHNQALNLNQNVSLDMSMDMAIICDLERNLLALSELFGLLVAKHPHLLNEVLKLIQNNDSFKDLQLSGLLPSISRIQTASKQ